MKEGMEKGERRGKDGKLGSRQKRKGWFQDGGMGEVDAQALLEIYKEQKQLHEALENELNKQGLGGSGQNALEKMKEIEKQILNKGFKNETLQKILNLKQELLKLNSAVQQQGKKRSDNRSNKESLIMILNRCQTHC
jgi:Skp family chaperone for outer membrane proteins